MKHIFAVARYRFGTTFGQRWGGYLALVMCIGLVGGLAMGAVAGARRTQSSFPSYFASVNPPDLAGITAVLNPLLGSNVGYNPKLLQTIAHLPHVKSVESGSGLDVLPLERNNTPINVAGFPSAAGNSQGSDDGFYFDQDRVTITAGRIADPHRANEILMPEVVAQQSHMYVGETIRIGVYTNAQTELSGFGTSAVKPYRQFNVTLVGTFVQAQQLIEDDVDGSQSQFFFTPAFTQPLLRCCSNYTESGIEVSGGSGAVALVNAEVQRVLPKGFPPPILTSTVVAKAERAIRPESIALGVFGGIAALAALLIASQIIGRQLRLGADDLAVLRALGADPVMAASDGLVGILAAVVTGSLLALVVAIGISPLTPIGPVRPVDPSPGVSFDWTVVGPGVAVLIVGLSAIAIALAVRQTPHRAARRRTRTMERGSSVARAAASAGLPAPAVAGIRFALEPGVGRNAVPVRSAILGAGLAIIVLISTVTFGASLDSLVSHPNLYGWNWNYVLSAGGGSGNIPQRQSALLLDADPAVGAWSAAYFDDLTIDGQSIPVIGESPNASVQPPILSGHRLAAADQVVLGALTLAQLHRRVGDTVVVGNGLTEAKRLTIVGTATMPTIGGPGPHLEMGTGALVSYGLIPVAARNPFNDPVTGPESIFVDARPGASTSALYRSLEQMSGPLSNNFNFGVFVGSVLRPAEIVNYRAMGTTPAILGSVLGLGAVVALMLTLIASVRRRRRDLALLKTLGFTRRQLAYAIAWQSSIAVGIGTVVGVPLGIVVGRSLWDVFANEIHAVPSPRVPVLSIVVIVLGAIALANIVAAVPGRIAARASTALLLRAE